jgi:WbqC-like protein family
VSHLAIMQPYWFPYLGYFQLLAAVDTFVIYDDVAYIKQGWINRNRLYSTVPGTDNWLTVPVEHASSHRVIADVRVASPSFRYWRDKLLKRLEQTYARAPYRDETLALVAHNLALTDEGVTIASLAEDSVKRVWDLLAPYCGKPRDLTWCLASQDYSQSQMHGVARVLEIVRVEGATCYVNLPGGRTLYSARVFEEHHLDLAFLQPALPVYTQGRPSPKDPETSSFQAGLSILDVLMWNAPEAVASMLSLASLEVVTQSSFVF